MLGAPERVESLESQGVVASTSAPQEFAALIRNDLVLLLDPRTSGQVATYKRYRPSPIVSLVGRVEHALGTLRNEFNSPATSSIPNWKELQ